MPTSLLCRVGEQRWWNAVRQARSLPWHVCLCHEVLQTLKQTPTGLSSTPLPQASCLGHTQSNIPCHSFRLSQESFLREDSYLFSCAWQEDTVSMARRSPLQTCQTNTTCHDVTSKLPAVVALQHSLGLLSMSSLLQYQPASQPHEATQSKPLYNVLLCTTILSKCQQQGLLPDCTLPGPVRT